MHTDSLLRRLRLLDCYEEPLDLQKAFQEVQIVGEFSSFPTSDGAERLTCRIPVWF